MRVPLTLPELLILLVLPVSSSFLQLPLPIHSQIRYCDCRQQIITQIGSSFAAGERNSPSKANKLLDAFKTTKGEILNPYDVLKISRNADKGEIKQAYYKFSRMYHPDGVKFRKILPGRCKNMDDVAYEWERVKLSYEILSNQKLRVRYDRNSAMADPGAAVSRAVGGAAMNFVGWGLSGVGKGMMKVGEMAFTHLSNGEKQDTSESAAP